MHGGDDGGDSPARPAKRQRPSAPVLDVPAKLKDPKKKKYRDGRLLLDARRLSFRHADAGRGTLELERAAVRDCKAAKGESTLVQVVAEGGAAGGTNVHMLDMLTKEAQGVMKDQLRAQSPEERAAAAEKRRAQAEAVRRKGEAKARHDREEAERAAYLEEHDDAREVFEELVRDGRLTVEDFWSDGGIHRRRFARALGAVEPEEEAPLAADDSTIRIHYDRQVLPRLLACQPALAAAHAELVVDGELAEAVFWQQYMCLRHRLEPAEVQREGSHVMTSEAERQERDANMRQCVEKIRAAVRADSRARLRREELELASDARDGMELLVGGASLGSAGARHRRGYGLLGVGPLANPELFWANACEQAPTPKEDRLTEDIWGTVAENNAEDYIVTSGRKQPPDILKQLNAAGDHTVLRQLLGNATLRHGSEAADPVTLLARRPAAGPDSRRGAPPAPLDIFDASYCYARLRGAQAALASGGSPRRLSGTASAASASALSLTVSLSGGGDWQPNAQRRMAHDDVDIGTPRARAFEAPTRANKDSWGSPGFAVRRDSAASPAQSGAGEDDASAEYKQKLRKAAQTADALLAHFWRAIGENDRAKVERLHKALEGLFEQAESDFSGVGADASLVPLYRKSLYKTMNQAFEAYARFTDE